MSTTSIMPLATFCSDDATVFWAMTRFTYDIQEFNLQSDIPISLYYFFQDQIFLSVLCKHTHNDIRLFHNFFVNKPKPKIHLFSYQDMLLT